MIPDDRVQVIRLDEGDAPTVIYVPGTGGGGISEGELEGTLEPYATRDYVDQAVVSGGDVGAIQTLIDTTVAVHRNDPTPHPAYDDHPSLTLRFLNGLV